MPVGCPQMHEWVSSPTVYEAGEDTSFGRRAYNETAFIHFSNTKYSRSNSGIKKLNLVKFVKKASNYITHTLNTGVDVLINSLNACVGVPTRFSENR